MAASAPATPSHLRSIVVALALLATRPVGARTGPVLDGSWYGTVTTGAGRAAAVSASGTLGRSGASFVGTLTLDGGGVAGTFAVEAVVHGTRARMRGTFGVERLRWRGSWNRKHQAWRGPVVVRGGGRRLRGMLALSRDGTVAPQCGNDVFAARVMPGVMEPICAQCHVPGGMAQAAAFRVSRGDAAATAKSALGQVDQADPSHSRLLEKPRGDVPHGGGRQIAPGSAAEQALVAWIEVVTGPACRAGIPGGPPPDGSGAGLYATNCASCHGPDARGLDGRPDIHCHRAILDAVRNGRGPAGEMPAFSNLTDADVQKIQDFLGGLCPAATATGAELYASNCAACHGADATGTPGKPSVRCATRVFDAVRVGRGAAMPIVPGLSDAEVNRIQSHLGTLCDQHGRPGADLWAGNCGTCHGADAGGGRNGLGVRGPDIQCSGAGDYGEAVARGPDKMPAFPALSASDVSAMASYVRGSFCTGGGGGD
jgi:mono/diheme cytochrome c family protein